MTTRDHAKLLGIFHLVQAGLQVISILVMLIYVVIGGAMLAGANKSEDQFIGGLFLVIGLVAGVLTIVFTALYAYSGWNLFKDKPHSKVLTMIVSFICLLGFPLGTALGIYGLWFVFGEHGKAYYDGEQNLTAQTAPPPPPNSWQ